MRRSIILHRQLSVQVSVFDVQHVLNDFTASMRLGHENETKSNFVSGSYTHIYVQLSP